MEDSYISHMHSGAAFDFSNPTADMVDLDDIGRGLVENRFKNQLDAQWMIFHHSILVGELCSGVCKAEGYMHDGSEAYTGDLPGPFKKLLGEAYKIWERKIELAIAEKFGLIYPWPSFVKECDKLVQDIEATMFHPYGEKVVRPGFKLLKSHEKMVEQIIALDYSDFIQLFENSLKEKSGLEIEESVGLRAGLLVI